MSMSSQMTYINSCELMNDVVVVYDCMQIMIGVCGSAWKTYCEITDASVSSQMHP